MPIFMKTSGLVTGHIMVDLYSVLYNAHVHVWKQTISELSGVTVRAQENSVAVSW